MIRSLRTRLVIAFVIVVAVAVGIAAVVAERSASRELNAFVARGNTAYLETLAANLSSFYAEQGGWDGAESVFDALPQAPGRLQLQDAGGGIVADSSPGGLRPRGPQGPGSGGSDNNQGGPQSGESDSGNTVSSTMTPQPDQGPSQNPSSPGGAGMQPESLQPSVTPVGPQEPRREGEGRGEGEPNDIAPSSQGRDEAQVVPLVMAEPAFVSSSSGVEPAPQAQVESQRIPIYVDGEQVGTLVVISSPGLAAASGDLNDRFLERFRFALLWGGLGAALTAIVLATLLVSGLTRPLRRLTEGVRRVASGDFSQRLKLTSPSEVAELASSFNGMAEALESDQQTRRRLLSDIVHELRTPLSVIQGTAQGFVDGVILADPAHASLIRDEAALLNKLITDLRDIALAESGELRLERAPTDVADLARQATATVQQRATEKDVAINVAIGEELPKAFVDRERTLQILRNLIENSLRHTQAGGRIAVRVRREGSMLAVDVGDTGEGIASDHLPHIFERFYRADPARAAGGTGLGLAIVKQLTEAQGGRVSVASEPGRGSTFTVSLPFVAIAEGDGNR